MQLKSRGRLVRKKYKKSLFVIPYFFTYLNAIFGFLSILKAFEGEFVTAAYYILLAAFMDCFDGRLARMLGSSSYFGMELDSLCDAVSFCLAPTILLYCWIPTDIALLGKLILAFYVCAGLARLAKFNTNAHLQTSEFIGLPTTMAAFFIASLVLYDHWIATHSWKLIFNKPILFALIAGIALLMISPIRFYSFKRYAIKTLGDYLKLLGFLAIFIWAIAHGYPLMLFAISWYIAGGIFGHVYRYVYNRF